MELQCSFFKRWEAAEVKMYKRFPNGTGGAIEEWGVDLDLLWGWWRRASWQQPFDLEHTCLSAFHAVLGGKLHGWLSRGWPAGIEMLMAWELQMRDVWPTTDDCKMIGAVFMEARIALLWLPSMKE
jgi:hypothetical protein